MVMDVKPFQAALNQFCNEDVPTEYKRRMVEVIIFLLRRIRYWTPVAEDDSEWPGFKGGNALANWRVTMGNIPSGTIGEYGNPARLRTEDQIRGDLTTAKQGTMSPIQAGVDIIWIFNNVHYIQPLENGHSMQAPKGRMVEMSIEETIEWIKTGHLDKDGNVKSWWL